MKTKIQKRYIDMGFGFPVHLLNVPMIKIRNTWTPKVNYKILSDYVLKSLAVKPSRLTGNELKFIRNKFNMTLTEFAKLFYVTHPAVLKWEKQKDLPTNMKWVTEKDIRLFVYINTTDEENVSNIYKRLRSIASSKKINIKVNVKEKQLVLT